MAGVEALPPGKKVAQPVFETFELVVPVEQASDCLEHWRDFARSGTFPVTWESKKGPRTLDARPLIVALDIAPPVTVRFTCSFAETYVSPLRLAEAVCPHLVRGLYGMTKVGVAFAGGETPFPAER